MAEELTTPEENKSVSPEELEAQLGEEESSGGSATPEGAVSTEPSIESDYEVPYPDGSKEKIDTAVMSERLINYPSLQKKVGQQADELGEFRRKEAEWKKANQPVVTPEESPKEGSYTDEEMEDPAVLKKAFGNVMEQNAKLAKQVEELPGIIAKETEEQESIREMRRVMGNHPKLKDLKDKDLKEQIVRGASAFGVIKNQEAGRTVYADINSAVDGYFALMKGEAEQVTQQTFVRNLKSPQNEVLPTSGGKPIGDVIKRYTQITDEKERHAFVKTLSDEELELISAEIK